MGKNIFKVDVKQLTHKDFDVTEDEWNNWLIDMFELANSKEFPVSNISIMASEPPVTITISKKNFYNYLDLGESSN